MSDRKLADYIKGAAEMYGRNLTPLGLDFFLDAVSKFPEQDVLEAFKVCLNDLKAFPTIADIVQKIQAKDGRPGVEEAWGMLPMTEDHSACWTTEMAEAFGLVYHMLGDDKVAARMAFKEKYLKLVSDARQNKRPVYWQLSLGHDRLMREKVLVEAVKKGRLAYDRAVAILPDLALDLSLAKLKNMGTQITKDLKDPEDDENG